VTGRTERESVLYCIILYNTILLYCTALVYAVLYYIVYSPRVM
jgi:hypothetical protein